MKKFFRYAFRIAVYFAIVLAVPLLFLCTCDIRLPDALRDAVCRRLSGDSVLVRVSSASFSFPRALHLRDVRVLDRTRITARPVLSAQSADVKFRPFKWFDRAALVSSVVVRGLNYPRLPEGYYIPDSVEFPGRPDYLERNAPVELSLPALDPFSLTIVDSDILGIAPERIEVPEVSVTTRGIRAKKLRLVWPERDTVYTLDGACELNLDNQSVRGHVHGQSAQRHIRPLLEALEVASALTYIDAFTDVKAPVDATCTFAVDLRNSDLRIGLDLHPAGGKYNGVPLRDTHGAIEILCGVRGTNQNVRVTVGPLAATLADGSSLAGQVICEVSNNVPRVYLDARSDAPLAHTLAVADVLNDGTLDALRADEKPFVSIKGFVAGDSARAEELTAFDGTLLFARGSLFGVPLADVSAHYAMRGTTVTFSDACGKGPGGGSVSGSGRISFPGFDRSRGSFELDVDARAMPLGDLAGIFERKLGARQSGSVDGTVRIKGSLDGDAAHLSGTGHVECACANIANINLFRSMFNTLVEVLPRSDRDRTLDQNARITFDFAFTDGKLHTDNLRIRSGSVIVFAVDASGDYDFIRDELDITAKAVLFRKNADDSAVSFAAGVADTLAKPFTSFLEARLTGSLADPKKESANPIKKIPFGKIREIIPFL